MESNSSSHHALYSTSSTSNRLSEHSSTVPAPFSSSSHLEASDESFDEQSIRCVYGSRGGDNLGFQLEEEEENQVHLSVVWHGGHLGAAYYDGDTAEIHMMRDSAEPDSFTLLNQVIHQIQPKFIVASAQSDERFLKAITDLQGGSVPPSITGQSSSAAGSIPPSSVKQASSSSRPGAETDPDSAVGDSDLELLPSIDYTLEVCKRRILAMSLPCIPEHFTEAERTIFFSSLVPFDCLCMVRAVGGLLKYLEKKRVGVGLEGCDVRVPVLSIRMFSLEHIVSVDDNTYSALQIFQKERHPSAYKSGGSGAREGLSLFGFGSCGHRAICPC